MKYIELTRLDGSIILINKDAVVSAYADGDHTLIVYGGENRQKVIETYKTVKKMLLSSD